MVRRWHRREPHFILLVGASMFLFSPLMADTRAAPEISFFFNHNNVFRSRIATALTWSKDKSEFTSAAFEYDLDVGLASFFRRYVFKDPNAEKSKRISIRLGYAYIPDLISGEDDERRIITEASFRFPLGAVWLLSDRNRLDFRSIGMIDSTRYRNRIRLERGVKIGGFRMTPYSNVEFYFNNESDNWNQTDVTLGAEFPWRYQTVLEFYLTWQSMDKISDNQVVGFTLQKHL